MHRGLTVAVVLALLTAAGAAGACAKAGARPILLGVTASVGSPAGDEPRLFAGARAAARGIDAHGGIGGRPVEILTCNNHGDPIEEVACARRLVGQGVVAFVGSYVYADTDGFERVLAAAGVPDIGQLGPDTPAYAGVQTFPLQFSPGAWIACLSPVLLASLHTGTVAIVRAQSPSGDPLAQLASAAAQRLGATVVADIEIPESATDYRPYALQAAAAGAGLVLGQLGGAGDGAFVAAARRQGLTYAFCAPNDVAPGGQTWLPLGSLATGVYAGSLTPPLSEAPRLPLLRQFVSDMGAELAAGDRNATIAVSRYDDHALDAWLAVQVVRQVAATIHGGITRRSLLAALAHARVDLGGILPRIDFGVFETAGPYVHVYNWVGLVWRWDVARYDYVAVPRSRFDVARAAFGSAVPP